MNCPDCKDKLDRFVDRELNNTEGLELQLHLEGCPECSDQYELQAHLKRPVKHACDCGAAPTALRAITAEANRLFVVNDHVDIALLSGADAVHLGPDDITVEGARSAAGDRLLIGASASTPEAGRQAIAAGADYLGVGPAFETPVKTEKKVIGPEGVLKVANAAGAEVPVFAIGGIDESNVQQLT